eukprot:m.735127 g.735127  ORF g.735127 m.735127 type:complete len:1467 (-) comp23086_c1_seq22:629-5029(-)
MSGFGTTGGGFKATFGAGVLDTFPPRAHANDDFGGASLDPRITSKDPFSGKQKVGIPYEFHKDTTLNGAVSHESSRSLPPVCRKGWVMLHQAVPQTRELARLQQYKRNGTRFLGVTCRLEMRDNLLTFFEGVSGVSMSRIYTIEISRFRAWSLEDLYYIEVAGTENCRVLFSTKEGAHSIHDSCPIEQMLWCKALAIALSAPGYLNGWILDPEVLPQPWMNMSTGAFGMSFSAKLNGVTPVAVTHVCLADASFPDSVDEIKQIAFLKDTCLSFKIQGPGILKFYGLFWEQASSPNKSIDVVDYYVITELCEGGTLLDALYDSPDEATASFEMQPPGTPGKLMAGNSAPSTPDRSGTTYQATPVCRPRPRLSHAVMRQLLLEILSGLLHLHRNQIVHRNIRPSTVALLRPIDQIEHVSNGIVKIFDLSHSARMQAATEVTSATPRQTSMSSHAGDGEDVDGGDTTVEGAALTASIPEPPGEHMSSVNETENSRSGIHWQLSADAAAVDVFSFGLTLFEMASQTRPWGHLRHLPMHEVERMVRYGSRPRFVDDDMLGVAALVRMCLMPSHSDRPSITRVLELVRHPDLFCSFECNTITEVFRAIDAQFWTWSPAVYAKLEAGIHATLWGSTDRDATVADEHFISRVEICLRLLNQHCKADDLFRLPLEALVALVLPAQEAPVSNRIRRNSCAEPASQLAKLKLCDFVDAPTRLLFVEVLKRPATGDRVRTLLLSLLAALLDENSEVVTADNEAVYQSTLPMALGVLNRCQPADMDGRALQLNAVYLLHLGSMHPRLAGALAQNEDVVQALLDVCDQWSADEQVLRHATAALVSLSTHVTIRVSLTRFLAQLLESTRGFAEMAEDITCNLLRILINLTVNTLGAAEFVECGGVHTVISIAKRFKHNVTLFTAALSVLENVSAEPEYSMQIAHEDATGLVMSAMKSFQEVTSRQDETLSDADDILALEAVCMVLISNVIAFPALQIELIDMGVIDVLTGIVLDQGTQGGNVSISKKLLDSNPGTQRLRMAVCRCFRYLAVVDAQCQLLHAVRLHAAIASLVCVTRPYHDGPDDCTTCVCAFHGLASLVSSPLVAASALVEIMDTGILPVAVGVMTQFNRDASVQRACLNLFLPMVSSPAFRVVCEENGVVTCTIYVLSQHQDDVVLVKAALSVIAELVNDARTRTDVIKAGVVHCLVDICNSGSNIANLALVERSTALLATVAYSHKCDVEFRAAHVRDVVMSLQQGFPENRTIQQHCAQIMQTAFPEGDVISPAATSDVPFKVVVVGDMSVGKTCFVLRGCQNTFTADVKSTIGLHIDFATIEFPNRHVTLQVYDTAGEEKYRSQSRAFYRNAHVAVLVYDQTQQSSFDSLQSFKDEVLSVVDNDKILFFVVGTKNDLKDEVCVSQQDVRKFAKSIGAPSFVVSAVANTGVHGTFRAITDALLQKWPDGVPGPSETVQLSHVELENPCC